MTVEGPYVFNINLLDMSFKHEFYLLDSPTPFIAGFDFIVRAGLVIDSINRLVWSKGVVLTQTLNQSFLTSNQHAENNDRIELQSNGERMNADNDNCGSLINNTSKRRTKMDGSTASVRTVVENNSGADSDIPDHLRVLFLTTVENNDLPSDVVHDFKQFLREHQNTFAKSSDDLGFCSLVEHDIDTGDTKPIRQPPRRPPLASGKAEDDLIDDMLRAGVIEPSESPWASPVCLVKKPDGTYRFCVDYRRVNAVSKQDAFPIPDIRDALDSLRDMKYYATIDLLSGYWQLGMTDQAKERSAFCTRRGLFHFNRMPFGLSGAPATFCRLMQKVLKDQLWKICLFYLDDVIVYAKTHRELLERLNTVISVLGQAGLKVIPSKCTLFKTRISFLEHAVSEQGVDPQPEKIEATRDVRAFFGLASYYRRFVKNVATIAEPLSKLTCKSTTFRWTQEAQTAFEKLKQALINTVTLVYPQPGQIFIVDTDASDVPCGAVLSIMVEGVERPVAFFSCVLKPAQEN